MKQLSRVMAVVVVAIAIVGAVTAPANAAKPPTPSPYVLCGANCIGGGTCGQAYGQDYANPIPADWYRVWLGVNFCTNGSAITSAGPYTSGCQAGGDYTCSSTNGPSLISGGVGSWSVTYRYSANLLFGYPFPLGMNTSKTVTCTVYANGTWSC